MSGKKEAFCILDIFQKSKLYVKLQEFLDTSEGSELLTTFERVTEEHCADIVSELHGIADGADLDYREVCCCFDNTNSIVQFNAFKVNVD